MKNQKNKYNSVHEKNNNEIRLFVPSIVILILVLRISYSLALQGRLPLFDLLAFTILGILWEIGVVLLLYLILKKSILSKAKILVLIPISFYVIIDISLNEYFNNQLRPLTASLFTYSWQEIKYTALTSGNSIFLYFTKILVSLSLFFAAYLWFKKQTVYASNKLLIATTTILLSISTIFYLYYSKNPNYSIATNKVFVFAKSTTQYFFSSNDEIHNSENFKDNPFPIYSDLLETEVGLDSFIMTKKNPNLVFLFIEGLSNDILTQYQGLKLMPFMDSISQQSLYWPNFFTLAERSFGVVPCMLGSLPFGVKGFTLLEKYPNHFSIYNILKLNGYRTAFIYGQNGWFHQKDAYFKYLNTDIIWDCNRFDSSYSKVLVKEHNDFFWGYNDKDLLHQCTKIADTLQQPFVYSIFTGSTHAPYAICDEKKYEKHFNEMLLTIKDKDQKDFFIANKKYFLTFIFADEALKTYFQQIKSSPSYENTIFIITGDHPMTEIPRGNALKKYNVPLLIYSPLVKRPITFKAISSQNDVFPSLIYFLKSCGVIVPEKFQMLSSGLDFSQTFRCERDFVMMDDDKNMLNMVVGKYFFSNKELFTINEKLEIHPFSNQIINNHLQDKNKYFHHLNSYLRTDNCIVPDSTYFKFFKLTTHLDTVFKSNHIASNIEFLTLHQLFITNKKIEVSYNIDITNNISTKATLVIDVYDDSNRVHWQGIPLNTSKGIFKLDSFYNIHGNSLRYNIYIWNPNKEKITVKQIILKINERF